MTRLLKFDDVVRIEGLHDEDHRFPYAALADQLDDRARDHFARQVNRTPLWIDGGKQMARRVAGQPPR